MKKLVKYILVLLVIALVGYKSVYFKKLSEVNKTSSGKFDAVVFTKKLWNEQLPAKLDSAIGLVDLIASIKTNSADAFAKHSNAMGIGNYRYSLVNVTGTVEAINEDEITLKVNGPDSSLQIKLATEYVYGNAIRDAPALVAIKDFSNTTNLNNISEELNKTVRTIVLPVFKKQVKRGDKIEVSGAIEFNKEHISFKDLELIPVRLKILQ
jgi:predicted lipoprotein